MAEVTQIPVPNFGVTRVIIVAAIAGLLGLVLFAIGVAVDPVQAFHSYLTAFAYVTSLALGALVFLMAGYAASARWLTAFRRITEAVVGALPALAVLFLLIPLGTSAGYLYMWADPPPDLDEHMHHLIEHKEPYLNVGFFAVRGVSFFVVWILAAGLLRRWSFARDAGSPVGDAGRKPQTRERVFASAVLPLVGLAITFAAFDWLMSLQPEWYSTAFGVYYFAGGFVGAMALLALLVFLAERSGALAGSVGRPHYHGLGRLVFAFTVFWAYIAYFQAMLIQSANKPEEVTFYVNRIEGGWGAVALVLLIGRFALPFFLLLPRRFKRWPPALAVISAWVLLMHYVDVYWLVQPMVAGRGPLPHWLDAATLLAVAGPAVAFAAWRMRGRPVVPAGDPFLAAGIQYRGGGVV